MTKPADAEKYRKELERLLRKEQFLTQEAEKKERREAATLEAIALGIKLPVLNRKAKREYAYLQKRHEFGIPRMLVDAGILNADDYPLRLLLNAIDAKHNKLKKGQTVIPKLTHYS